MSENPGRCERCGMSPSNPQHEEKCAARAIIQRYARLFPSGQPVRCTPSLMEIHGAAPRAQGARTDGKPIYDTLEKAEAAARELEAIGYAPLRAHECRRSRHAHHHLTRDNTRRRGGRG